MLGALRCPVCEGPLSRVLPLSGPVPDAPALGCEDGHRFDIARQGYVSLLGGGGTVLSSDTADMIAARRTALETAPYRALRSAVAAAVAAAVAGRDTPLVVDAGCGTGQYLSSCLTAAAGSRGVGLDLSKYAARAAAKCHPRAAAVVADLWQRWPVASGAVDAVLAVFAPRGFTEAARVLAPGAVLVVLTPRSDHLAELITPMGMLGVAPDKLERLAASLAAAGFGSITSTAVQRHEPWSTDAVFAAVAMGPSAFHADRAQLRRRVDRAGGAAGMVRVTTAVDVTVARI